MDCFTVLVAFWMHNIGMPNVEPGWVIKAEGTPVYTWYDKDGRSEYLAISNHSRFVHSKKLHNVGQCTIGKKKFQIMRGMIEDKNI